MCVTATSALGAQCGIYHLFTTRVHREPERHLLMIQRCLIHVRAQQNNQIYFFGLFLRDRWRQVFTSVV